MKKLDLPLNENFKYKTENLNEVTKSKLATLFPLPDYIKNDDVLEFTKDLLQQTLLAYQQYKKTPNSDSPLYIDDNDSLSNFQMYLETQFIPSVPDGSYFAEIMDSFENGNPSRLKYEEFYLYFNQQYQINEETGNEFVHDLLVKMYQLSQNNSQDLNKVVLTENDFHILKDMIHKQELLIGKSNDIGQELNDIDVIQSNIKISQNSFNENMNIYVNDILLDINNHTVSSKLFELFELGQKDEDWKQNYEEIVGLQDLYKYGWAQINLSDRNLTNEQQEQLFHTIQSVAIGYLKNHNDRDLKQDFEFIPSLAISKVEFDNNNNLVSEFVLSSHDTTQWKQKSEIPQTIFTLSSQDLDINQATQTIHKALEDLKINIQQKLEHTNLESKKQNGYPKIGF